MFQHIKYNIFHTRWHVLRILQLFLSVLVFIQAITEHHHILLLPSLGLMYMALMNTCSACTTGGTCSNRQSASLDESEVKYHEIKEQQKS